MVAKLQLAIVVAFLISLTAPNAAAEPLAPPIAWATPVAGGILVEWILPPLVTAEVTHIAVFADGVLDRTVDLPGDAAEWLDDKPLAGRLMYVVQYEAGGQESPPGYAFGYPWCLDWVIIKDPVTTPLINRDCSPPGILGYPWCLDWVIVKDPVTTSRINWDCIMPLPIP